MATALRPQSNFIIMANTPKETAYGTIVPAATLSKHYPISEPVNVDVVRERTYDDEHIKGHEFALDTDQMTILFQDATVPVTFPASAETCGLIYSLALGTVGTTGAGPYVHTITAQAGTTSDQLPSTSFVVGTRGQTATYYKYKGCIPNEVRYTCENRGRNSLSTTFFTDGTEVAATAGGTDFTIPTGPTATVPFWGKNATFKIANAGSALVDQSTLLRSFEVTLNNNLSREDAHGLIAGGVSLTALRFASRMMSFSVKIWGSKGDAFYATDFATDVLKDVELKVTNGSNDYITFNFDRCVITEANTSFDDIRNVIELVFKPYVITASTGISPVSLVVGSTNVPVYIA